MVDDALHLRDTVRHIEATLNDIVEAQRRPQPIGSLTSDGRTVQFQFEEMPTLDALETAYIRYVLARCGENRSAAAQCLGIDPSTLYRKLARLEQVQPGGSGL